MIHGAPYDEEYSVLKALSAMRTASLLNFHFDLGQGSARHLSSFGRHYVTAMPT